MLGIATFGDAKGDLVAFFNTIPIVGPEIVSGMDKLEAYIKEAAKAGAEDAIPDIQAQVKTTVKPYILAVGGLAMVGTLFGVAALVKIKRGRG